MESLGNSLKVSLTTQSEWNLFQIIIMLLMMCRTLVKVTVRLQAEPPSDAVVTSPLGDYSYSYIAHRETRLTRCYIAVCRLEIVDRLLDFKGTEGYPLGSPLRDM